MKSPSNYRITGLLSAPLRQYQSVAVGAIVATALACGFDLCRGQIANQELGVLEALGAGLPELVKLRSSDEQLTVELASAMDASTFLGKMTQTIGTSVRGGSSSGGSYWRFYRVGHRARIELGAGDVPRNQMDAAETCFVSIAELVDSKRSLSLYGEGTALSAFVIDSENQYLLMFTQRPDSGVTFQRIDAAGFVAVAAPTLGSLGFQHDQVFHQVIAPEMARWGLLLPQIGSERQLQELALECLRFDEQDWEEFRAQYADLGADTFAAREGASQQLIDEFDRWRIAVVCGLLRDDIDVEMRSRLSKSLQECAAPDFRMATSLLIDRNLLGSPRFLMQLVARAADEVDLQRLAARLESLTGESHGDQWDAWKAWVQEHEPVLESPPPPPELKPSQSLLAGGRRELSRLLRLTLAEDHLQIDRESWRSHFDNRDAQQVIAQLRSELKRANVPKKWLNLGSDLDLNYVGLEQMLFEHFECRLNDLKPAVSTQRSFYRASNPNEGSKWDREFIAGTMCGRLTMLEPKDPGPLPADAPFEVRLDDATPHGCQLRAGYSEQGALQITICDPAEQRLLLIRQEVDGASRVCMIEGELGWDLRGDSFRAIYETHGEVLRQRIWPALANHGIDLAESLGGPLAIENLESIKP